MLIVPDEDTLIVEAKVPPQDIDQLQLGQRAVLRFSAFNQRTTPELNGEVIEIGADVTQDEKHNESYYSVRIRIPDSELARLEDCGRGPACRSRPSSKPRRVPYCPISCGRWRNRSTGPSAGGRRPGSSLGTRDSSGAFVATVMRSVRISKGGGREAVDLEVACDADRRENPR